MRGTIILLFSRLPLYRLSDPWTAVFRRLPLCRSPSSWGVRAEDAGWRADGRLTYM